MVFAWVKNQFVKGDSVPLFVLCFAFLVVALVTVYVRDISKVIRGITKAFKRWADGVALTIPANRQEHEPPTMFENVMRVTRGHNYLINNSHSFEYLPKELRKNGKVLGPRLVLITNWNISHFLCYAIVGFATPDLFELAMCVSVFFETFEAIVLDAHDVADLFWNATGFIVGRCIRQYLASYVNEDDEV